MKTFIVLMVVLVLYGGLMLYMVGSLNSLDYERQCKILNNTGLIDQRGNSLQCYKDYNITVGGAYQEIRSYIVYYNINNSWVWINEFQDWDVA